MCLVQFEPDSAEFIKVGRQGGGRQNEKKYVLEAFIFNAIGVMLSVLNTSCGCGHVCSSPCPDSRYYLRRPGEAQQVRACVLHQAFWRNGLVPGQCSQDRRAPCVHVEERAVSLLA